MEAVRADGSPMKVGSVGAALTATTGRGKTFLTESTGVRTHVIDRKKQLNPIHPIAPV